MNDSSALLELLKMIFLNDRSPDLIYYSPRQTWFWRQLITDQVRKNRNIIVKYLNAFKFIFNLLNKKGNHNEVGIHRSSVRGNELVRYLAPITQGSTGTRGSSKLYYVRYKNSQLPCSWSRCHAIIFDCFLKNPGYSGRKWSYECNRGSQNSGLILIVVLLSSAQTILLS